MKQQIPLVDLKTQYKIIKSEIDFAIESVISSSSYIGGQYVESFEQAFANYQKTNWCIGVSSGTNALFLALKSLGIQKDDEIITSPLTFMATVEAIEMVGGKTVFVDIDPFSYTIDPEKVEATITSRTRAIIPVHIYGQMADMTKLCEIAERHGLFIVEDAAQAHGATHFGKYSGELGHAACFSFFPSKNLGAYGDGGAVCTNDSKVAERVYMLRDHGRRDKYVHNILGYGERLDGMQAAILKAKLFHLDTWNKLRQQKASYYENNLSDIKGLILPQHSRLSYHVFHIYCINVPQNRDQIRSYLISKGIGVGVHYPIPLHLQPCIAGYGFQKGDFPITEKHCSGALSLPIYPEITHSQMDYIIETLHDALNIYLK
jgi:dTDP-4-amino-4,6-dideoxygalactose transaminase